MDDPGDLVVAITSDDSMVHVGPADAVRAHLLPPVGKTAGFAAHALKRPPVSTEPAATVQVFDAQGRRLTIVARRKGGRFARLFPREVLAEEVLIARIGRALDHMQTVLAERPELGSDGPIRHTEVPRPVGSLPAVLAELAGYFDPLDPTIQSSRGNWLHNLAHAAGLA